MTKIMEKDNCFNLYNNFKNCFYSNLFKILKQISYRYKIKNFPIIEHLEELISSYISKVKKHHKISVINF